MVRYLSSFKHIFFALYNGRRPYIIKPIIPTVYICDVRLKLEERAGLLQINITVTLPEADLPGSAREYHNQDSSVGPASTAGSAVSDRLRFGAKIEARRRDERYV